MPLVSISYFSTVNEPLMMTYAIRPARREDCPRLLELVRELAAFEKAPEAVTISLEDFTEGGFGDRPIWWAFVAEADGGVVAFTLYYIRFSTWTGPRMYLEDIIVTQAMRGHGIGRALWDRLVAEAHEKGFRGITWQVLDWNKPAIDFYQKRGARLDPEWINGHLEIDA